MVLTATPQKIFACGAIYGRPLFFGRKEGPAVPSVSDKVESKSGTCTVIIDMYRNGNLAQLASQVTRVPVLLKCGTVSSVSELCECGGDSGVL